MERLPLGVGRLGGGGLCLGLSAASAPLRRAREQRSRGPTLKESFYAKLAVGPAGLQAVPPARAAGGDGGGPNHCPDTHRLPESLVTLAAAGK